LHTIDANSLTHFQQNPLHFGSENVAVHFWHYSMKS